MSTSKTETPEYATTRNTQVPSAQVVRVEQGIFQHHLCCGRLQGWGFSHMHKFWNMGTLHITLYTFTPSANYIGRWKKKLQWFLRSIGYSPRASARPFSRWFAWPQEDRALRGSVSGLSSKRNFQADVLARAVWVWFHLVEMRVLGSCTMKYFSWESVKLKLKRRVLVRWNMQQIDAGQDIGIIIRLVAIAVVVSTVF